MDTENKKIFDEIIEKKVALEKRIFELEKENAELKKKLKPENCLKLLAKEGYIKFTSDQLTEAKEIIKELLDFDFLPEIEIKKKAEEFLKCK